MGAAAAWLAARVRDRRGRVTRELPALVDFLATAAEAGLPLEVALERVRREFPGVVADTFAATRAPRAADETLPGALKWTAERVGHPDGAAVTAAIARAQGYGTPLGAVLSDLGRTLRQARRARERAGRTGILLIFPLVVFIVPVTVVLLGYPAAVNLLKTLVGV
ncbi:MAG TPA: type II secretion system F family protein [Limnochordales bacterium]